jgi:hypothetical protein
VREEEFEALCSWGEALARDPRAEVVAAGRAIQLLAAEVERLEMELWNLRLGVAEAAAPPAEQATAPQPELAEELHERVKRGARLRRLLASPSRHLPGR